MRKADLHIHTYYSDGRFSPADIVERAKKRNLAAISITDHDTYEAYEETCEATKDTDIKVIPGAEFTADFEGREVHLLAYNFNPKSTLMLELVDFQRNLREDRAEAMVKQLEQMDVHLSMDDVKEIADGAVISRPHLAVALRNKGYVRHFKEAFYKYLGNDKPGYVKSDHLDVSQIIKKVHLAGGVTSIAHPGRNISTKEIEKMIDVGLDGIEVIHPSHQYAFQKKFEQLADYYDLLKTGGSDFHGRSRMEESQFGIVAINPNWVQQILERRALTVN